MNRETISKDYNMIAKIPKSESQKGNESRTCRLLIQTQFTTTCRMVQ